MRSFHPGLELDMFELQHRRDIAAAERHQLIRAHGTKTASPCSLATRLRRAWAGLVGARPRGANRPETSAAGHAVTPSRT
jgi:hypothetical protein